MQTDCDAGGSISVTPNWEILPAAAKADAEMLHIHAALRKILRTGPGPIDAPEFMTGMWPIRQQAVE